MLSVINLISKVELRVFFNISDVKKHSMAPFVLTHVLLIVVTVSIGECANHVNPCNKHCELTSGWSNWDCSGCHNNVGNATRYRSFCCFLNTKQECLTNCSMVETDIIQQGSCINICYIPTTKLSTVYVTPSPTTIVTQTTSTRQQTSTQSPKSYTDNPTSGGYIPTTKLSTSHATPSSTTIVHNTPITGQQISTKSSQISTVNSTGGGYTQKTRLSTVHETPSSTTIVPQTTSTGQQIPTRSSRSSTVNPTDGDYIRHGRENTEAADICGGTLVSIGLFLLGLVIGAVAVAIIIHCCCYGNSKKEKHPRNQTYGVRSRPTRNKELFQSANAKIGSEYYSSRAKNIRQVSPVSSTASLINPWSEPVEHSPSRSPKYPSPILDPNSPLSLGWHRGSCVFEELPYNNRSNNSRSSSSINNNNSSNNNKNYNNSSSHTRVTV